MHMQAKGGGRGGACRKPLPPHLWPPLHLTPILPRPPHATAYTPPPPPCYCQLPYTSYLHSPAPPLVPLTPPSLHLAPILPRPPHYSCLLLYTPHPPSPTCYCLLSSAITHSSTAYHQPATSLPLGAITDIAYSGPLACHSGPLETLHGLDATLGSIPTTPPGAS